MDLFQLTVPVKRLHPIFRLLLEPDNAPERAVLQAWAADFRDRDGKFVKEFQTTFESSFWELYLHAALKGLDLSLDYAFHAPDFVVTAPHRFVLEATIAAPAKGCPPAFGPGVPDIPADFTEFNREAILRICNSLDAKVRRYRQHYATLAQVRDQPFVIAIAPFDRPHPQLAANRPITAALYGTYYDEEATIAAGATEMIRYVIDAVQKHSTVDIPVGLFSTDAYKEVSAVVYGPLATWGKLRALADAPARQSEFMTIHPAAEGLVPNVRRASKHEYREHLLDGLYVLHNPFAERPLPADAFHHERIVQFIPHPDGSIETQGPEDFLLMRMVFTTVHARSDLVESGRKNDAEANR